jgi:type I restriction enzyme, S subunit
LHQEVQKFKHQSRGTTINGVTKKQLAELQIALPPLDEQQQIVSKIEELFSELDKGIEELKTAQQQLKVYCQAVLKWAFEGKLTSEDVKDSELPKRWKWAKLTEVSKKITDGEHFRPQVQETGIPFLSAKDVRDNGVSFEEPLYISEETAKKALLRCNPERGDILIVSRGATVGRMCIVKTDKVFCLLGSVILIKAKNELSNDFLTYILKSPQINRKLISISGATAQQAIYLRDIKEIQLPLPSLEEQQQIVQEIESRLSVCDKIEETITASLKQAEALRQSILKKAFEGKII